MDKLTRKHTLRQRASIMIAALILVMAAGALAMPWDVLAATPALAEDSIDINYNFERDCYRLPDEEWWIRDTQNAWVWNNETHEGEDREYRLTNMEVVSGGELLEFFRVQTDDDGQRYFTYRTRDMGATTFKVTYEKLDGGVDTYTFTVNTVDATSDLDLWVDSENGSTIAHPGASIPLMARATYHEYDVGDSYDGFEYRWEIVDDDQGLASISSVANDDGSSSATVTFAPAAEGAQVNGSVKVVVTAVKGDTVADHEIWLDVASVYPEIWFKETNACKFGQDNIFMGDSVTVTPEVRLFTQGTDGYTVCDLRSLEWYFDENCFTITDSKGHELHTGDTVEPDTFTVTRIEEWGSDIRIGANWHDPEWGDDGMRYESCYLWFNDCHAEMWFDEVPDDVFVRDASTTASLTLMTDNLPEGATIKWTAGLWSGDDWADGQVFSEGTEYTVSDKTITLKGAEVMKHLDGTQRFGNEHVLSVRVSAEVLSAAGMLLNDESVWVNFCEPGVEYEYMEDQTLLLGQGNAVNGTGWATVWDEEHPWGEGMEYRVTDVQISSGGDVLSLHKDSNDQGDVWWWYDAMKPGRATLTVTHEAIGGGTQSYSFDVNVGDTSYSLENDVEKMAATGSLDESLLPGDKGEVWMQGWRHVAIPHEEEGRDVWYEYQDSTDGFEYRWSLQEGADLATLTQDSSDPTHVTIAIKKAQQGQHINGFVLATCELYTNGKKVAQAGWAYRVEDEIFAVQPVYIDDPEVLCSVTVDPKPMHRYVDDGGNAVSEEVSAEGMCCYWSFDPNVVRITDATGAEVTNSEWGGNDTPAGSGPFTITRLSEDDTGLNVMFRWDDEGDNMELEGRYRLGYKDYQLDFDQHMYKVYEGGVATLTLDLSRIAGIPADARTITVMAGDGWDPDRATYEHPLAQDAYTIDKTDDAWTITIPYAAVKELMNQCHAPGISVVAVLDIEAANIHRVAGAVVDLTDAPFFLDADPTDEGNHGAEVDWMGRMGISTGWVVEGGREFRGRKNVTRCDFAAFMYRLADLADDGARNDSIKLSASRVRSVLATVSDCTEETSHAAEVAWLIDSGISKGWPDKGKKTVSFRPMANVARQDMAAFLYRFADIQDDGAQNGSLEKGAEKVTFKDVRHGDSANHADEVEWLASIGVTKGWENKDGTFEFRGLRNVARQDMAAFMYRLNSYLTM